MTATAAVDVKAVEAWLRTLPEKDIAELKAAAVRGKRWVPNPGPQTDAYRSKADVLLFGGEPGGGKSQLGIGLAFNEHKRSLIMRRQYTDLSNLLDGAIKVNGSRDGFNGSPPPRLTIRQEQFIDFGAAARIGDEQHWMGRPHDLIVLDEATQFTKGQVLFFIGWLRHEDPNQRTRMLLPTNPPLTADGAWVHELFAPWLDPRFPNPAQFGELRWAITDEDGKHQWVDGPEPVSVGGKRRKPLSWTYIYSPMESNPEYATGNYRDKLDAMPEPYRSILLGGFKTTFRDAPTQIIPTAWVRAAQERWTKNQPVGVPMCAMGVDVAQGGEDETVIAIRYDGWFAPMIAVPGKQTPHGKDVAGLVLTHRRGAPVVVIDMGGGYGGAAYEHLKANDIPVRAYRGAEKTETRTKDRQLKFVNTRSMALWRFREALDPSQEGGSPIMLPDDPLLVADLTAATFEIGPNGIKAESKEDVCERLGRSTDRGDAVVMSWAYGERIANQRGGWAGYAPGEQGSAGQTGQTGRNHRPQVLLGRQSARSAVGR